MNGPDWEIYTTDSGYRAELFKGADPRPFATVVGRSKAWLYVRMLITQWWHR